MLRSYEALVYILSNRVVSCASIRFALRKVSVTVTAELAGWPGLLCARFLGVARSVNILIDLLNMTSSKDFRPKTFVYRRTKVKVKVKTSTRASSWFC